MSSQKRITRFLRILRSKATIFFVLVVLFFMLAPVVLALETGLNYGTYSGLGTQDIRVTIMKIIRVILGFVGVIAIVIVIYGGYTWMTSGGNAEKIEKAKKILINAVIGLVIIFSAFAIVSFIIRALEGALAPPGPLPGGPIPGACENCSHLGSGIIQSVYPEPWQRDVPRNTSIMVTFKIEMDPGSIIDGCTTASLPCLDGNLATSGSEPNVKIFGTSAGENTRLGPAQVRASSNDGKTFVFKPVNYLGDGVNNIWYSVKLLGGNNGIKKANGDAAWSGLNDGFLWRFEVGSFLDLDPVELATIWPQPDDDPDSYALEEAVAALGSITLTVNPKPAVSADAVATPDAAMPAGPQLNITGTYNGTYEGTLTLTLNSGDPKTSASAAWDPARPDAPTTFVINSNSLTLGDGLVLSFVDPTTGADQWDVALTPARGADTLRVDTKIYVFVNHADVGANEIYIAPGSTSGTATNITEKINNDNLAVTAERTGSIVNLEAKTAGTAGNLITVQASESNGLWADTDDSMSGGAAGSFLATPEGAADKARNAVFVIDFNEAVDPIQVTSSNIIIERSDPSVPSGWSSVAGTYLISNQYRTIEILSDVECLDAFGQPMINSCGDKIYCWPVKSGTCSGSGADCESDLDCPAGQSCNYEPTNYRITINAGLLKDCTAGNCTDPNFPNCVATASGLVCQGSNLTNPTPPPDLINAFYPEAKSVPAGIIDAAFNSFNGNDDTYILNNKTYGKADGPQLQSGLPAYSLNDEVATAHGDNLVWSFYLNKSLDLTPPNLTGVGPNSLSTGVSLTLPIEATFNEPMMSSSLKSGSNYRDGYCECDPAASDCVDGQTCEVAGSLYSFCKNGTGEQQFCLDDKDCKNNTVCHNRKYVTLINRATFGVGWWLTKRDLDISPQDGYADQTAAVLRHTKFAEVTDYGTEVGSGVKDLYQNCYLPSKGPAKVCRSSASPYTYGASCNDNSGCSGATPQCVFVNHCANDPLTSCDSDLDCEVGTHCNSTCDPETGFGCCGVTNASPFCCDGRAMSQSEWEASTQCRTEY
ncbi:MAG: TrbC/VirB2 family protein [Patescibacteria group bacterium]|jgi:hypothetical protein